MTTNTLEVLRSPLGSFRLPEIPYFTRPLLQLHGRMVKTNERLTTEQNSLLKLIYLIEKFFLTIITNPPLYALTFIGALLYGRETPELRDQLLANLNELSTVMRDHHKKVRRLNRTLIQVDIKVGNHKLTFKKDLLFINAVDDYQNKWTAFKDEISKKLDFKQLYFSSCDLDFEQTILERNEPDTVNIFVLSRNKIDSYSAIQINGLSHLRFRLTTFPPYISDQHKIFAEAN